MGNKYSQISTDLFPNNYFVLIFRQPDIIQAINAETRLIENFTQVLETYWQFGIKNEKKIRFGYELKLNNTPFANEPRPLEKIIRINQLICAILCNVVYSGYEIVTSGYILKTYERSSFIFRKLPDEISTTIKFPSLCSIIFEGWNRIIINNLDATTEECLLKEAYSILPFNIISIQSQSNYITIDLDGQPWDSHKPNSIKSPLLFLNLIRLLLRCGYKILTKAHITGYNDTIFLMKHYESIAKEGDHFILSLNQLDKLRTYCASSGVINTITKTIKSHWEKGLHSDSIQDKIWISHLNGSPWSIPNWDKDSSFNSKLLVMEILKELRKEGWEVILTTKLYRSQYDKSLFLFQYNPTNIECNHFISIGPHDIDRMCLTSAPKDLINQLREKFSEHWPKGLKEDLYENGCTEYIMEGKPWYLTEESYCVNLEGIGFFLWVLEHICDCGWSIVETVDICSTSAYSPTDYVFSKRLC